MHNIRFYILAGSIGLSVIIYLWIMLTIQGSTQIVRLVDIYGFLSLIYLYLSLLAGPFCYRFRWFLFREKYLKARRALGVGVFYFALLHTCFSFFGQLDGFAGLEFLGGKYLFAVIVGFIALIIFSLLAITSFDYAVTKLSFPKWKLLHRFIYLAGILVLIHSLMLGIHYSNLSSITTQITFIAIVFLLALEEPRFYQYISHVIPRSPIPEIIRSLLITVFILIIIWFIVANATLSSNKGVSFDIHAGHRQLAQQSLQQSQQNASGNKNNLPGLNGDRTKRYTVSMSPEPANPQPNQNVTIRFKVYDASSGNRVTHFRILYAKPMHFIVVTSDLTYFTHNHPILDKGDFVITTKFPKDDLYHLYISFQPFGGIEQQIGFTLPVGQVPTNVAVAKKSPYADQIKTFGDYTVSVDTHGVLEAQAMSAGFQKISFTLKDTKTRKPVTTLKPYLASFGHLTMIKQDSFDFIHVHPYSLITPSPNAIGGPTVDFLPIGIYGPFKPGIYRVFAEFNPDNHLLNADFTIQVK